MPKKRTANEKERIRRKWVNDKRIREMRIRDKHNPPKVIVYGRTIEDAAAKVQMFNYSHFEEISRGFSSGVNKFFIELRWPL